MMKNIINKVLLAILSSTILTGCESFLDRQPLEELSKDKFWNTTKDADLWMIGMYDAMQNALGDNYFLWGDSRSDIVVNNRFPIIEDGPVTNMLVSNFSACNWSDIYRTISSANFAIKYLPKINEITEEKLKQYMGQAYTARALMYFYAIRIWGDVPLITEPYEAQAGQKLHNPRTAVSDVKAQIMADIESALNNFDPTTPTVTELNRASALALKMDVHMWFKEYNDALKVYDNVVSINKFAIPAGMPEWKNTFESPTNSKDIIFSLSWDNVTDGRNGISKFVTYETTNPTYKVTREMWDTLISRKADFRWQFFTDTLRLWHDNNKATITEESYNIYMLNFYNSKFARWDATRNLGSGRPLGGYVAPTEQTYIPWLPIYRFTDLYLMRAEALNKVGRADEARKMINDFRRRNGYLHTATIVDPSYVPDPVNPDPNPPTIQVVKNEINEINAPQGQVLEDIILQERRIEFFGEGKRWFDLVRTDNVKRVMDPVLKLRGVAEGFADERRILWPLHSSVFETNPLLKQNEPYTQN